MTAKFPEALSEERYSPEERAVWAAAPPEMREAARAVILEDRAYHEAGHAVAMWRARCDLFDACDDPGFEEIIVGSFDETEADSLILADGRKHEGGGVVVGILLHRPGLVAELRECARNGTIERSAAKRGVARCRELAEAQAAIFLAGSIAEHRNRGRTFDWRERQHSSDIIQAYVIASEFHRTRKRRDAWLDRLAENVSRSMSEDRYWSVVKTVASALIEHRRLAASDAVDIMVRAWTAHQRHMTGDESS